MIKREADKTLLKLAGQFKAVALTGPRQSGKTTIARHSFGNLPYVSLENPDYRRFAVEDPRGFLSEFSTGAVFDEIQKSPEIFSYLQQVLDESKIPGRYILTGSNNFLLQETITQSLAGRIAHMVLLPFSLSELPGKYKNDLNMLLIKGFYPPIYDQPVDSGTWLANYISTYIERDVRQIRNITNLYAFERMVKLCAGRTGQMLNMNSLALETGVDTKTIASWIGILESSFVIYRLKPHYRNYNKRIVKMPKLYFYDTGLVCSLLGIQDTGQLVLHPMFGSLFENFIIGEFLKSIYNRGSHAPLYYWRDNTGHEIDLIIESPEGLIPIEIKSGKTIMHEFFNGLRFWQKISGSKKAMLIYAGDTGQNRSDGIKVFGWRDLEKCFIEFH